MKNIKSILIACGLILAVVVIPYTGWKVSRWWNYKFNYQSQVQKEIEPLVKRIDDLEQRIYKLETNDSFNPTN